MTYCTIDGCDKPIRAKGMCERHYYRNWKHGDPLMVKQRGGNDAGGLSRSPEYRAWLDLRRRCNNPTDASYDRYGGRGISVCERWEDFNNFLEDMGRRPGDNHSIDRINNNGNYEPGNCRWATWHEQAWNRRKRSEHTGVRLRSKHGKPMWVARLKFRGVNVLNNEYATFERALEARKQAERDYLGTKD